MSKLIAFLFMIHCGTVWAQSQKILGSAEQEGLDKTQDLMRNPEERNKFIRSNPRATEIDNKVDLLTGGGKDKEEVYDIASKVMEKIVLEAKGDPEKMKELILKASANPKAFYDTYFSAEDKKRVKNLADSIEKKQGQRAPSTK